MHRSRASEGSFDMSRTPSDRGVSTSKPACSRRFSSLLVCATMMLAPLLALVPTVSSDHVIIDNPDYTNTVLWDLNDPDDYLLTNVTMGDGQATLARLTESGTETTGTDFASGYRANMDYSSQPGSMILDETTTFKEVVTIELDDSMGCDTYIDEDKQDDTHGTDNDIRIGSEIGRVLRTLIRFDVSSIPSTAVVNSAVLKLYELSGGKGDDVNVSIHALDVPFVEDEATWAMSSISSFWTNPGGDYGSDIYYKGTFDNTAGWRNLDVTTLVECWVRGHVPNNGMIFVPEETGGNDIKTFMSSDDPGSSEYKPKLVVDYAIQGSEGAYESDLIGPGTNATFTAASWSNSTLSFPDDEFSGTALSSEWTWWNNPALGGGSYNVGVTTPGWLHVTGEPNTQNSDEALGANLVYQEITGDFTATTSLRELFTINAMDAGMLIIEDNTSWLSISKSDTDASGKIRVAACENGISSTKASVAWADMTVAQLKAVRDSTGLWLFVSPDGVDWTNVYQHIPQSMTKEKVKVGLFLTSNSAAQPTAEFDFFRVTPPAASTLQLMVRTGNSSSLSDPSWTDWSAMLPGRAVTLNVDAKYMRYRVYMSTPVEWYTPVFHEFSVGWERYAENGTLESHDFTPTDFSIWLTLHAEHDDVNGRIDYYYSVDSGECWEFVTSETTGILNSVQPSIRVRANVTTHDTLATPSIESVSVVYGTGLSTFYVEAPDEIMAGEYFDVGIWAKNSANETMSYWLGEVTMEAMNAAGTSPASAELETTSGDITHAGHLEMTTQRYYVAETIRILVTGDDIVGLSAPIVVNPAPVASIELVPEGLEFVIERTTTTLEATAFDEYGNDIADAVFSWTLTGGIGTLSVYYGDSVDFTASDAYSSGYINVTAGSVSVSMAISIEPIGHPPVFLEPVPTQTAQEDGPTWTHDLGPYVFDRYGDDLLRWYVTNETLVTASDENRTGNLELTLTPNPDMYGSNTLKLFVVDTDGFFTETELVVEIEPVNDGPTIDLIPPLAVHHDLRYVYNLRYYITDIDNEPSELQLSVDSASERYVDVDAERLSIGINYPEDLVGTTQSIVVTVDDGELEGSTVIGVDVSTNNVPVLVEGLPDITLYQGEVMQNAFNLADHFMDPDEDVLYYVAGRDQVIISITNGQVDVQAPFTWAGEEYVVFSAIDPEGARVEDAILVTVLPVNGPPWIDNVPDLAVRYDKPYEFDLTVYIGDADDPVGSLLISTDSVHIAIIGTVLSLHYPESMNGSDVSVNISISDGELSDWWAINVTVSDNTPPESLDPPDHSFTEDWPIPYPPSGVLDTWFEDEEDGNDLEFEVFSWSPDVNASASQDGLDRWALWFWTTPDYYGESKLTIRATDSEGAIVEETIVLTIVSAPDSPVFDINRAFSVTVGVETAFDLSPCLYDPDSDQVHLLQIVVPEEYGEYITANATLVRLDFPEDYLSSDERSRIIDVELMVVDTDGMWDTSTMTITISKPVAADNVSQWGLFILLFTIGTSIALFGMVMSMRKKPFVIRDMMLVHEDGFLISRHAESVREDHMDEDIFTGMLTAVLNFVDDSMSSTQEHLKFFGFEHYRVMVRRGQKLYAAIIFEGDRPKDIDQKLTAFLAKVEKIYRKSLQRWTGDIDVDFAGAHLLIKTFVEDNGKKSKGWNGNNGRNGRGESDAGPSSEAPVAKDYADRQSEQVGASSGSK